MFYQVYVKLAERFKTNKLLIEQDSKKYNTIHINMLNLTSEWMAGKDGACNEFMYEDEGLTWAQWRRHLEQLSIQNEELEFAKLYRLSLNKLPHKLKNLKMTYRRN